MNILIGTIYIEEVTLFISAITQQETKKHLILLSTVISTIQLHQIQ